MTLAHHFYSTMAKDMQRESVIGVNQSRLDHENKGGGVARASTTFYDDIEVCVGGVVDLESCQLPQSTCYQNNDGKLKQRDKGNNCAQH